MLDWTTISSDPTDFKAMEAVKQYLAAISHVIDRPWNCKHSSFSQFCDHWLFAQFDRAGPLLDIGFADHTCDPKAPAWRHGRLRAMVENCCGLDLNAERVATIQKTTQLERLIAGDFTQNPALPFDQFSGIFAGDVIEHMDNPGALLHFIRTRLSPSGITVITTPNCYGRNARRVRKTGIAIDNLEHTAWISPFQMNELCRRHQLNLQAIIYFREGRKRKIAQTLLPALKQHEFRMRDCWSGNYSYILAQPAG